MLAAVFSEEVSKPEGSGAGDGTKSVTIDEAEPVTLSPVKTKKSREDQPVITNIESLYFANTHLFQGLSLISMACHRNYQ